MTTMTESGLRELDHRSGDGLEVRLLWDPRTNGVAIAVDDARRGDRFCIAVDPKRARDAFEHPYAYALAA